MVSSTRPSSASSPGASDSSRTGTATCHGPAVPMPATPLRRCWEAPRLERVPTRRRTIMEDASIVAKGCRAGKEVRPAGAMRQSGGGDPRGRRTAGRPAAAGRRRHGPADVRAGRGVAVPLHQPGRCPGARPDRRRAGRPQRLGGVPRGGRGAVPGDLRAGPPHRAAGQHRGLVRAAVHVVPRRRLPHRGRRRRHLRRHHRAAPHRGGARRGGGGPRARGRRARPVRRPPRRRPAGTCCCSGTSARR